MKEKIHLPFAMTEKEGHDFLWDIIISRLSAQKICLFSKRKNVVIPNHYYKPAGLVLYHASGNDLCWSGKINKQPCQFCSMLHTSPQGFFPARTSWCTTAGCHCYSAAVWGLSQDRAPLYQLPCANPYENLTNLFNNCFDV